MLQNEKNIPPWDVPTCSIGTVEAPFFPTWEGGQVSGLSGLPLDVQRGREQLPLYPDCCAAQEATLLELVPRVLHQSLDTGHTHGPELG